MTHKATRGWEFLRAMADALGLEGVRRMDISVGIDEPLVAKVELLVDESREPAMVEVVKQHLADGVDEANANNAGYKASGGRMDTVPLESVDDMSRWHGSSSMR